VQSQIQLGNGKDLLHIPTTQLPKMKKTAGRDEYSSIAEFLESAKHTRLTRQISVDIVRAFSHNGNRIDLNDRSFVARLSFKACQRMFKPWPASPNQNRF
jgi:hypothetical protein